MKKGDNDSVNPHRVHYKNEPIHPQRRDQEDDLYRYFGLTKREYFAVILLHGMVSGYANEAKANVTFIPQSDYPMLCTSSIELADELLKHLKS